MTRSGGLESVCATACNGSTLYASEKVSYSQCTVAWGDKRSMFRDPHVLINKEKQGSRKLQHCAVQNPSIHLVFLDSLAAVTTQSSPPSCSGSTRTLPGSIIGTGGT